MPFASHLFLLIFLTTSSSGWWKGLLPFYLSSVIFDNVQNAETRVGAQGKSIRFVETVHCCSKSGPGVDPLFSHFLWVSSSVAQWVSKWNDEWTGVTNCGDRGITAGRCYCLNEPMGSCSWVDGTVWGGCRGSRKWLFARGSGSLRGGAWDV